MRAGRRVWPLLLMVLLVACSGPPSPAGRVEMLPTLMELPSMTPQPSLTPLPVTPSPSATATDPPPTATPLPPTATFTPTRSPMVELVIAVQPIPAGAVIPAEAVQVVPWPEAALPVNAVVQLDEVIEWVSLADVACYEPLLPDMLARRTIPGETPPLAEACDPLPPAEDIGPLVDVVIAARYLEPDTIIQPHLVALRPWPQALLPPGALTSLAQALGGEVQRGIFRGQPLLAGNLAPVIVRDE